MVKVGINICSSQDWVSKWGRDVLWDVFLNIAIDRVFPLIVSVFQLRIVRQTSSDMNTCMGKFSNISIQMLEAIHVSTAWSSLEP